MTSNIGGPLFVLRWKGGICPCLEKPEDKGARLALEFLSGLNVQWYRSGRDAKSIVGGIVSGWFGGKSSAAPSSSDDSVDAILAWIDTEKGPELQIQPQQNSSDIGEGGGISLKKQGAGYIKTIPLKQLDRVSIQDETYLVLQNEKEAGKYQDLVTLEPVVGDIAQIKEALTQLVEWDGRRRAAIPEDERELDEEQGIKAKAKKTAHFAKREIEMQKQRREREKRKAALVKESGGLKYTAIAMANRMDDS